MVVCKLVLASAIPTSRMATCSPGQPLPAGSAAAVHCKAAIPAANGARPLLTPTSRTRAASPECWSGDPRGGGRPSRAPAAGGGACWRGNRCAGRPGRRWRHGAGTDRAGAGTYPARLPGALPAGRSRLSRAAGDAFWRFATDGNHDGVASPYDPADAIPTAAAYLCQALRDHHGELRAAVLAYNHAGWYADRVLALAADYGTLAVAAPNAAAQVAVDFARAQLGVPYRWGGDGPGEGGFDCSGLTHAAYQTAGIQLPRTAQTQYQAGPQLPPGAPLVPGDLVFFGTSPAHVTHVGMVVGPGQMIDAPHRGALVRIEPYTARPTYLGATRPATR